MNESWAAIGLQLLEITWINILLSGDNAVVIALACRGLPADRQRLGILLGGTAAIGLRLIFTLIVVTLLALPFIKIVAGLLLLWIAIKLVTDDHNAHDVSAASSVWAAVRTIALADAVMSLDNVIAIAAAARDSIWLIVFGLLLSVPLIMFGATLILRLIERFPWLVWAGAMLLGSVSGDLIASDAHVNAWLESRITAVDLWSGITGVVVVVAGALAVRWVKSRRAASV